ncbi:Pentatricopeptide repeat-containing protein [Cynara cardunculus var. scolymus]|uniref:Pentatricopeptide repeat-containing protein n=1 Tax=Cynara cardunculus var. scolymus TaxID=59895 RepID=A0A103Y6H8_CYNCS|nr:Pentatricopeptide repeat-containing protein [Cynara cardunculus var. scolymus]
MLQRCNTGGSHGEETGEDDDDDDDEDEDEWRRLSEWLESRKMVEFNEKDYASDLDLIAKAHGLQAVENYIEKIPESFRGQFIYETLLVNCVSSFNKTKTEQVFNKMKDLKFPITISACNQLLLLYKKTDKKKIIDVLLLMEEKNVEPSIFTYQLLVDIKSQANDIDGMEKIVETMKAKDIEPDLKIHALLARHYMYGGLNEKANVVLHEMERSDLKENRRVCLYLLPLYVELGSADDVKRVWEVCKSNCRLDECMNAINAWGKLRKIEEAEAMAASGCQIGPLTWDALVKLYIEAGELEKADSFLHRASEQNPVKPFFDTYMMILKEYARRGDIHNAEKMFHRMRQDGYVSRPTPYHSLLQTYINTKASAYGFRERVKADNIMVNHSFAGELALADPFNFNRTTLVYASSLVSDHKFGEVSEPSELEEPSESTVEDVSSDEAGSTGTGDGV